jgi:hypothetical protein
MNEPPISPEPRDGFDLDQALNALVDDELAGFAADHGLTEAAVRERLEATPNLAARRASLERTRAAVGAPIAPLDDVTRHRLVRDATRAGPDGIAPAPRLRRWIAVTAIAAAVLLAVAGIGVAVSSISGDSSTSSSSSDSGASSTAPLRGDVGDLGDVTSPAALKTLLDRRPVDAARSSTTLSPQSEFATGGDVKQAPTPSPASTARCARELAGRRPVVFTGTGTYQGAPVTIVGIRTGGRTIVFVVSDADCTNVVASISR